MDKNVDDSVQQEGTDKDRRVIDEIQQDVDARIYEISREFSEGFKFLAQFPLSVTFFGSARFKEGNEHYDNARSLAKRIVEELKYSVVTGGGPGIMEAANRGALDAGGQSIGLTIRLPQEQVMNPYLTTHRDFYYFFSRKVCLAYSAEAYVFFPGGFGTLDEFYEIITLLQTQKTPETPVILCGSEYWNKFHDVMKENLLERGVIDPGDLDLYTITDDLDEALRIIKSAPVRKVLPYNGLRVNPIDE